MRYPFVALLACAACLGMAAPHAARSDPIRPDPVGSAPTVTGLPVAEILTIVRSSGYAPAGRPVRQPGIYVVRALDRDDRNVDLTLDAGTGRILAVRRVALTQPTPGSGASQFRRRYVYGPMAGPFDDSAGFEDATGALPLPPRSIPGVKSAAPKSSRSAAVLPLPRARPTAAAPQPSAEPPPSATAMPPVTPLE